MILLTLLLAATVAASPTAQPSTPVATTTAPPASTATATLPPRAAVPPAAPPTASLPSSAIPSTQSLLTTVVSSSSATVTTSRLPSSTTTQVTSAATTSSSSPAPSTIGGGAWTTEQLASLAPPAHLPTLLEERLDTLACDISLPPNAKIWRANQTEELLLPIQGEPVTDSNAWSGTAVVQTGDVLLVKIDDSALEAAAKNRTRRPAMELDSDGQHRRRQPDFSVYQVTRLGYENCDATEGVLLDITPLQVDNRQVVTLYDKDLTEGINLLIVVSTKWLEERCVRLRVVVKADNCGDAQDCSAKGVCFTNGSMEGYECQCCAGFVGAHCEEQDACYPSPCENHGICVDISQGHEGTTFQCLCPYAKPIRTKLLPYLTKLRCRNHRGSVEKIRTVLKGFKAMVTSNTKEIELDGLLTFCPFYKNKKKLTEVLRIIAKNAPNLVSLTINERNRLHECVIFHGKLGQDALEQISKLRGLKKLCIDSWHVNFFDLLELCKNLPALVNLEVHFENAEEQGGRSVFEVEDRFKESFGNLRVFLFAIHNPCPDEFTKFCIENLPKLEIVQARVDSQLYTTPISRDLILPCKSSSLRHLCTEPLDRPLHQLFPEVTHLKVFPLKDVILIPEIDALMNFSRIEYLCLSVIPTLAILNRLLDTYGTNLKGLELDEPQCSIKLETIFQKCPQLEKLIINCVEVEDADQPINNFSNLNELVWNTDYQNPAVLSNILSAPSLEKISLEGPYFDLKDLKKVAVLIAKKRILRHLTSFCHTVYEYQKAGSAAKLVLALSNLIKIASSAIPTLTDVKIGMNFKCVCTRKMKHVIHRYQYSTDHL